MTATTPPRKPVLIAITVLVAVALALGLLTARAGWRSQPVDNGYQTAAITRGDVVASISASGTLNPLNVVSVGTQVSGTLSRVYVDYNATVERGQLLAELDPSVYRAAVTQSRANLASARASLDLARLTEQRNRTLFEMDLVTRQQIDEAVQRRIAAQAQVAVAEGQLAKDTSNLGYTKIYAPIAGVVLSREVAVGQTVAASFQTPTLFKIAESLSKMQMACSVAEADIGALKVGQRVAFTVDAFPGKPFTGTLAQVRLDPKVDQGLVLYTVIVTVGNSGGELMPGMTATANIILAEKRGVLRVPVSAITYGARRDGANPDFHAIYVSDGRALRAIRVATGLSDGEQTEIRDGELSAGTLVVVGEKSLRSAEGAVD